MTDKERSTIQEQLATLYLRLNGYFTTGYIIHSNEKKITGELDIVAVRFPFHHQDDTEHNSSEFLEIPKNIDLVIAEVVDEHYQPVPPGSYGSKLLVTTLFSRTQPLIRYELNDSVRISTKTCPSGLPFAILEGIQGRVEDTLYVPAKSGDRVAIQSLVFNRIMDILPISGWQVTQNADDTLTVLISGARGNVKDSELERTLSQALGEQGASVPSIKVQRISTIPKTPSGKTPLIKGYKPLHV